MTALAGYWDFATGEDPRRACARMLNAQALYGPLPEQLKRPDSFASELRKMLRVRAQYRINESEQVALPAVKARGLVVMVHRLPVGAGTQVTVLVETVARMRV